MSANINAVPPVGQRILVDWNESDLRIFEARAGAAVTPGHLLQNVSESTNGSWAVIPLNSATSGSVVTSMVADLNFGLGGSIDDAYAENDTVYFRKLDNGAAFNAILSLSQTVARGDAIMPSKTVDGEVAKRTGTEPILGYARESVTTTSAVKRIIVEVQKGDQ